VSPTRELTRQIMDVIKLMGKYTKATYYLAVSDLKGVYCDVL